MLEVSRGARDRLCYVQSMPKMPARPRLRSALSPTMRQAFPPEMLVMHQFPLEGHREAVRAGLDKNTSQAMKVVFRPND